MASPLLPVVMSSHIDRVSKRRYYTVFQQTAATNAGVNSDDIMASPRSLYSHRLWFPSSVISFEPHVVNLSVSIHSIQYWIASINLIGLQRQCIRAPIWQVDGLESGYSSHNVDCAASKRLHIECCQTGGREGVDAWEVPPGETVEVGTEPVTRLPGNYMVMTLVAQIRIGIARPQAGALTSLGTDVMSAPHKLFPLSGRRTVSV